MYKNKLDNLDSNSKKILTQEIIDDLHQDLNILMQEYLYKCRSSEVCYEIIRFVTMKTYLTLPTCKMSLVCVKQGIEDGIRSYELIKQDEAI